MPQAARPAGRSPGQARRERESAGGTGAKATGRRLFGRGRRYQKKREIGVWRLHSTKGTGPKAHAAGRAAGGEIPRPGEARTRKRWGHWGEGYRPSLVRASAPLPKETRNRCVTATFPKGTGPGAQPRG